jgi:hypothetical protein
MYERPKQRIKHTANHAVLVFILIESVFTIFILPLSARPVRNSRNGDYHRKGKISNGARPENLEALRQSAYLRELQLGLEGRM